MVDLLKKYIDNRLQLIKLELITVVANLSAGLISSFLILTFSLFILLMFSLALAFWLAVVYESNAIGFLIVGGIYTLVFIIYFMFVKKAIDSKVKDEIVKAALNADKDLKDEGDEFEEI